jgi:DNA repair photolyase
MKREKFNAEAIPKTNYLVALTKDARKYQGVGVREQVLLSFTTDVYNPFNRALTRPTIEILIAHGLGFCVLTKGGTRALKHLDLYRPTRDAFASTLTSLDDSFSRKWEPGAALPGDRLEALERFHDAGIFTWAGLEPTLGCDASLEIIRATHTFVDLFKIGKANYIAMSAQTDWQDYTLRVIDLCQELGVNHYIKRDLQKYLPAGYINAMRRVQHN